MEHVFTPEQFAIGKTTDERDRTIILVMSQRQEPLHMIAENIHWRIVPPERSKNVIVVAEDGTDDNGEKHFVITGKFDHIASFGTMCKAHFTCPV